MSPTPRNSCSSTSISPRFSLSNYIYSFQFGFWVFHAGAKISIFLGINCNVGYDFAFFYTVTFGYHKNVRCIQIKGIKHNYKIKKL